MSGAASRSSRSRCWPACRPSRRRCTRRRRSTAPRGWQRFRYVTLPLLTPIIAVVMTFSVLFTFTDFQLIYVLTRGGPLNATHLMATLSFQRAIPGGVARRGRGDRDGDDAVPAGGDPVQLLRPAAAHWQQGGTMTDATAKTDTDSQGMDYPPDAAAARGDGLHPAGRLRLRAALSVLLDGDHAVQARRGADLAAKATPSGWPRRPSRTSTSCCSTPTYPEWLWNTMSSRCVDSPRWRQRARGLRDRAPALPRAEPSASGIFLAYLVPPSILFIPLPTIVF